MNPRARRLRRYRRRKRAANQLWVVWCVRRPGPNFLDFYRIRHIHPNHALKDRKVEHRHMNEPYTVTILEGGPGLTEPQTIWVG